MRRCLAEVKALTSPQTDTENPLALLVKRLLHETIAEEGEQRTMQGAPGNQEPSGAPSYVQLRGVC